MALLKEATTPHLAGELFKLTFGLDLLTVPFNGKIAVRIRPLSSVAVYITA
jgi:hypothetical protein